MDFRDFAINMIRNNPNIKNNPRSKDMIDIIMSGDQKRGEEYARNLCRAYGDQPEDALKKAKGYFGF